MGFALVYLRLYGRCVGHALTGIAKNLWTLVLPVALFLLFRWLTEPVMYLLGRAGGIALGLAESAIFSCYLYFTGAVVAHQTASLKDLKSAFFTYFWSVIGLRFVFWIAQLVVGPLLAGLPNGNVISLGLELIAVIVLNPAPEVIYLKGTRGGLDTIQTCVKFIQENWIEWFIPNGLLLAGAYWFFTRGIELLPPWSSLLVTLVAAMLFHLVMVFRGHLFEELDGTSHRQRMYKYRTPAG